MNIFEANNPEDIAEPRASVMLINFETTPFAARTSNESGPRVKLAIGKHEFYLTHELADILCEEIRVAVAMCKVAEGEYSALKASLARSFAARINTNDFDVSGG